jgi:NAD dependent epimerase/dehydratase family enzyme
MAVDFALISLIESCSRVAHWSGKIAKASPNPIDKRRFTECGKAVNMPLEVIVTKWFMRFYAGEPVYL